MTTPGRGTPHLGMLKAWNPTLDVVVVETPEEGTDGWRNYDRQIRQWWIDNGPTHVGTRVLFLEWDVLVQRDLREVFPVAAAVAGIEGAAVKMPVRDRRSWPVFNELDKMPPGMRDNARGIAPLSVVMISADALDAIVSELYDAAFEADIFCELRLPTAILHAGFVVAVNAGLAQVGCTRIARPSPDMVGVFHPVKK